MDDEKFFLKRQRTLPDGQQDTESKPRPIGPPPKDQVKTDLEKFLDMAAKTNFEDSKSRAELEKCRSETELKEKVLHELAKSKQIIWYRDAGDQLLRWMIRTTKLRSLFDKALKPAQIGVDSTFDQLTPLELAIDKENHDFLDCFLSICKDNRGDVGDARTLLQLKSSEKGKQENCLHRAIRKKLPSVQMMVRVCNPDALMDENSEGNTPLHLAMMKDKGKTVSLPARISGSTAANTSKRRSDRQFEFKASRVIDELKSRDSTGKLLASLLVKTNKEGLSPYQLRIQTFNKDDKSLQDSVEIDGTAEQRAKAEKKFQSDLEDFIFSKIDKIAGVSRALYGTRGREKELSLDMSDFNASSHDFKVFIDKLTTLDGIPSSTQDGTNSSGDGEAGDSKALDSSNRDPSCSLNFESYLFFVYLPDFNNFRKPCPHEGVRALFRWLKKEKHVERIKTLNIPDNTTSPMSDEFVHGAIVQLFQIEKFDWRKLDLNLDILTRSEHAAKFTELTLYSSGNWSVLYHWTSDDGLPKLAALEKVTIKIVPLNPSDGIHDKDAQSQHTKLVEEYRERLLTHHESRKDKAIQEEEEARKVRQKMESTTDGNRAAPTRAVGTQTENVVRNLNYKYKLDVDNIKKWSFPVLKYSGNDEPFVPKLQFLNQLLDTYKYLDGLKGSNEDKKYVTRFQELTTAPEGDQPDQRIKVAIIDNGVDRIRANIKDMIAKGISFVSADQQKDDRTLPWWMVSDPHGTQMASLVGQANNYCRLYIARVGKGRKDILPDNAAEAIKWALEQNVDVISISWVIKSPHEELRKAILEAVQGTNRPRPTLVFCSTADEGVYSGPVYPAGYEGLDVVSVAATDSYGNLRPPSDGKVNIRVPGENIEADGPSYMSKYVVGTVSGSSVATALAAGIASLALLMLKTFNDSDDITKYYTKAGIMKVFEKMNGGAAGVQLEQLFPPGVHLDPSKLRNKWLLSKFDAAK